MQVRAGAAAGIKTTTDIQTGKRSLQTHPNGEYVWEAKKLGDPVQTGTQTSAIKDATTGVVTPTPASNPMIYDPAGGVLGATGGTSKAIFEQQVRNDRGQEPFIAPDATTDAKTGRQYVSKTDPTTGATVKTAVGIDQPAYDKIQRDQQYQAKALEIDMRDNAVKQHKMRFEPQFKPVADEFTAAKKEVEALPPVFTKQGAVWKYTDPQTLKEVTTFDTAEVERNKALRTKAEQRLATAQQAYERMSPTASNLERNEKEIKAAKLKLESDKLRMDAGLPEDDGGVAELIAYDNLLKENKIGEDWTPEKHKQVFEHLQGGGQIMTDGTLSGSEILEGTVPTAPGQIEDRPLIPQDSNKAALIAEQFQGLVKPEEFAIGESGQGFTFIKRNGEHVGRVVTEVGEKSLKQPVFVVNDNLNQNADIRQMIAFGGTKGMDIYLGSNARPDPVKEAEWTAGVFGSIRNAQEQGFPSPVISAMLKEAGADQLSIFRKVRNGELSVQRGEAIMRDLYGTTLKADDPLTPGAIDKYMAEQAPADLRKQYEAAKSNNDTAAMNEVSKEYLNNWFLENRMKPGVTLASKMIAEKAMQKGLRTGEKAANFGAAAGEMGASSVGMMAALYGIHWAEYAKDAATDGNDAAWNKLALKSELVGRGFKNTNRAWAYNAKRWLTPEGKQLFAQYVDAGRGLGTQIAMQDIYVDGVEDPKFKADFGDYVAKNIDAAMKLHEMGLEEGWEITREDLEKLNWMPAMAALTGDMDLLKQWRELLLEDHGTRQAEAMTLQLTQGKNRYLAAFIAGSVAPPQEILVEAASWAISFGAGKMIYGGAKTAQIAQKSAQVAASATRVQKLRAAGQGLIAEYKTMGMVPNTLANPASALGKARNQTVKALKVGAAGAATNAPEEAVMSMADRNATAQSIVSDFLAGGAFGAVMPIIAAPSVVMANVKRENARKAAAAKYADHYNRVNRDTEGFVPLSPKNAEVAMALVPDELRAKLIEEYNGAADAFIKAAELAAKYPNNTSAQNNHARAHAAFILAKDKHATAAARHVEAVQAIEATDPAERDFAAAVAKVASGRADLLTSSERKAAAAAQTLEGKPYFADVNGKEVVTDDGRADAMGRFPQIGALIETTESSAIRDINEEARNQAQMEAEAAAQPLSQPEAASGAQGDPATGGSSVPPLVSDAPGLGNPSQPGPAEMEAGLYEAARQADPSLPDAVAVVSEAIAQGRPISVSMAKEAQIERPVGYTRQGNMLVPDQQAQSADTNTAPIGTAENPFKSRAEASSKMPMIESAKPFNIESAQVGDQVEVTLPTGQKVRASVTTAKTKRDGTKGVRIRIEPGQEVENRPVFFQRNDGEVVETTLHPEIFKGEVTITEVDGQTVIGSPATLAGGISASVSTNPGPVENQATTGESAPETADKANQSAAKESTPAAKQSPARQVAEQVKANVEASMPRLKGRIVVSETGAPGGGGANIDIESGIITLFVDDIARAIQRSRGDLGKATLYLENIVARHEAVHVVQVDSIRAMWEEEGSPGKFTDYFDSFYDQLGAELLTPKAIDAARKIYGQNTDGTWKFDKIRSRGLKAAEFTRMLVEAKMNNDTAQFSELLRVVKNQGAKSRLAKIIAKAIQILRGMKLSPAAEAHVQQLVELHAELSAPKLKETPDSFNSAESNESQLTDPNALRIVVKSDGTAEVLQGSVVLNRGTEAEMQIELDKLEAARFNPILTTTNAIKAALEKFPRLAGKLRAELEDAADVVTDELEAVPPGERMALAEKAIADRINLIADREAERTGKDRMEVIEGFRAVAGKRAAKQAASIESAVVGKEAPQIPTGRQEKRDTPNSEMSIDVTSTFVDLDQLIGSSDPLFPGSALQPRNRATQASQNQREEMVQNIRDKEDQHRRYIEGATTDSGRMVVAPLFSADGTQMTNEAGKPLFYVISGNGRRNALKEAASRNVSGKIMKGFRETAASEGIDVDGMTLPVPVSVFVPSSAKEAIDLAEYSNRDAQLSVSNTEQSVRDAASIEKAGILKLWEPDNTGDAAAASNRDFVKAFARAVGDEGVIDNAGNLTEEGAKRIERAMVAMLLGSEQSTLLDILFNRASPLGLRAILGGVASETGALLKLASSKPDFDLSPVLANALKTAVEAKQAVSAGQFRDVSEFFDQGSLFESTENTPERQLARAIVESRSRKAVREILAAYRKGAEAVDTSTMSMFAEAETTREDLILKALEARPIEQVIAEIEAEFGKSADLPTKLRVGVAAIKRLDAAQRREFAAAIGAEADRLRAGIISAVEWQRLNPDALGAKEALFQRFLDSHDAKTIASGFNRLLTPKAQAVLGSSAEQQVDPRLTKEFGENFEADEYGLPKAPVTLPDGHPLLEITKGKKTANLLEDHPLVVGGYLPAGQVSRKELGRAIIRYFMEHGTQLTGKPTPLAQGKQPVVYATGGGGGAGKSTILKFLQKRGDIDLTGAVLVNADDIKEMIPEFEEMKRLGDGRAAATVHEESSQLAKNLLDVLLNPNAPQRFNFIYDATLGHPESSRKHFDRWKSVGYLIHFIGVTIDPKEAMIRAVLRGKGSGRWVPSHMLAEAHQGFNRGVDEYIRMSDMANLVDNTPPEFHEIGKKSQGEDTISIVNAEYLAILRSRESDVPKTSSQARSRLQGMAGGESGGRESGGRSPIRQVQSEGRGSGSQGTGGSPGESSPLTPTPYYVRLTKGDKGNDPIEPTGQEEWAKRNPKSAAKLREIIDRQARAKNYTTEKVYHGTASEEQSKKQSPYGSGDLNYTGTKPTDWDEVVINERGAFYVTDDKDVASQFAYLKTRYKGIKARYIELYAKQGNYFDSSNPDHRKAIQQSITPEELRESNLFWDDFLEKNPEGGIVDRSKAPTHWAALLKGDVAGWQVMEDRNVIARLKSLGFEGYRSRETSPDEDMEIDFVSLGVFNPSSVKSADLVTFDKEGNIIPPAARFDDSKPSILFSSAEQDDLFGGIEEAITGPRAKAKRNALEQMRKAPPKTQAGIAKQIAKREGLEDLDLFAAAAMRNLDAKPRRGEATINASGSGQLGFDFDSGTPAGQQADATRRAGGIRADQATLGRASRSGEQASQTAGEGAASDVQGADAGRSGSGDGSPATDSRDGRGGRAESGNREGGGQDGGSGSPEAGKRKLVERERPPVGSPERNFTIGKDTVLAEGGTVTRLRNNLAAIDLLRNLEKEGRNATTEEKAVLARYVGWGGIPQVFDEMMFRKVESGEAATRRDTANTYERYGSQYAKVVADYRDQADAIDKWNQKWGDHYRKLKEMLSPEEWTSAQESTINAHYTSPKVIRAMWDAVKRLGFLGGNILEPAGGVGHYFGLMPPSIAKRSQLFGVELDSISGRIFGKLYPEGQIEVTGFQDSTIPDNSQSLVISNVPFANINISDAYLDANPDAPKFNLHNYFFEKALRVAQPGGLIAFITTSHTMDSQIAQRKWLAERADFLGAIRLPNNAFKENANTEVVTDIIFLRKPDGTPNPVAESWTATAEVSVNGGKVAINEYFARHPEMILGRLANDGSMYAGREEMTVHGNGDLADQLREAIARLPENVVGDMESAVIERLSRENAASKDGAFIEENGKLVIKGTGEVVEAKQSARVRSFITLRDTLNSLYLMESDPDATDADISRKRAELNRAYDTFRIVHKELHNAANKKVLSTDPDFYRTLGLETPQKSADGTKTTFTKADVFTKRILEPRVEPTSAESIEDAMIQSLRWKGRLDTKFVGKLMNLTMEQAESNLLSLPNVFRNPATGMLEQSTGYLAGNVRRKLRDAELAAQTNPDYNRNVEELRAVMPVDVDWADIQYKIGSTWIPAEVYQDFIREKLMNGTGYPEVIYNKGVGEIIGDSFVVNSPASYRHAVDEQWGVMTKGGGVEKSAFWVAEKVLNQEDPRINRTVDKKQVYDAEATETARAAAERMADAFIEWVDANPDLQDRLHKIYNESFNSHVIPKYDGSFMQLPWVAKDFDLYPSKKHVVWRALQEGSMLVAHGVGGGKTIIGTAVAMEVRRLGLAKKPMIVVHNATLEQFATTITQMAPTARVLVARKEDLAGGKRKEFMGRIRSGDWDAVVMAHSTFDLIPDDPAWERQQINELLEELDDAIRAEGADPNETEIRKIKEPSVKELVKMRKRLKDKISKLQDRKTDDVLTFQELGIDTVIVDEAHRYKKMPFVTRQSNIAGIDTGSSQRGTAMHLRSKWIQAQNGGRGVYTMTGTPVTNTLGESWNMIRLVRPDLLKEFAVQTFDRFVSVFGNIKQSGELRPNGQYKPVTRLAEFTNIPEWNRFWGLAADVKMGDDMDVKGRPKIKGGKPALTAVERTPQVAAVIAEITKVIDSYDKMTGKEKRENSHVPLLTYAAARMAAIDVRLVNPEAADDPGSKVNAAIANVMRIYKDTGDNKGTQVIFSDSYRPLKTTKLDLSAAEFEQKANEAVSETDSEEGFNLYHDIREKLVKAGVPRSEIAIIGEAKNDKQREIMFEKVNTGEIRIIMGSTETLGTGVNMQKRMFAAHHLDVPWTPAGLEQRDGRVFRQGNMWAGIGTGEIEIMRYGMKDTLDAALWQKLETKERMIKQAVSGEVNARVIEDDAGLLNYMEQKAALSGADGMLKFELDDAVRQFKNQFRTHRNRDYDLKKAMIRAQAQIDAAERNLPELRQAAELVAPLRDVDAQEVGWSIEGGETLKGEKARKALDEMFKARRKKAGAIANAETAPSLRESIRATANGVPVVFRVATISEDLANVANPDQRWQIAWQAYFPGYESASSQASPHPGSNLSAVPALVRNIVAAPDSMERAAAQARKDIENFKSESGKPFPKLAEFRKTLIDQAALYDRMGISRPEGDDLYQNVLGEGWQEKLKGGDKTARAETPANYPGAGLAPQEMTLGSSEESTPDLFTATRRPDAAAKLGQVRVGTMNALGAYRTLTAKREKLGKLTAKEEQQLLDAEVALGQKLAFDMDALKTKTAPPDMRPAIERSTSRMDYSQMEMSRYGETDRKGQMALLSSEEQEGDFSEKKAEILKNAPRDKDGHPLAPNGKRSSLTEDQWATVRTANFKRWFGDWVAVETKRLLAIMQPFQLAQTLTGIEGVEALKNAARKHFREVLMIGNAPITKDGREIEFTMTGFKEMARHSADSRVMRIIPSLPQLIENALPIFSELNRDASKPNIKAYHHYAIKATLGDGDFFVRLVARETNDGHVHYDADATSIEALKESGEVLSTQPDRKPKPGEDVAHLAKNRLAQWWKSVNPETVSKVVDGNGEPLVMYHGGTKGLSEFNRTDRPDSAYKKGSLHSQGIWLAQLRGTEGVLSEDYISSEASTYALNQQDGGQIYDLFANIRNPKRMGQSDASYETTSDLNGRGFDGAYMIDSGFWAAFNPNQIKSATDNNGEFSSNPSILFSSAEEDTAAVEKALASMKPIHRAVFESVNSGMTPEQVMAKYSISSKAVSNILDQVRSRIASVMKATTADGLTPAMRDGKFDGGRPDLALSTIPQVAAIDQIRNESGLPGVRAWADILPEAERMLAGDYQGTYDRMLAKARNMEQMSDLEVAATKMLISRETMEGRASTPAERVKLALLIHGYRDIGTETARSLAIRRDPHKNPAQRHAQFIAEALFTPDEATRKALRDATPGQQEEILSSWMRRVDAIKQELKARGLDLDASLAAFNEKETARKGAEADSPRTAAIIETQIRKLNRREKAVIEAIRSGSLITKAAYLTGLSTDEVKAIYLRFQADMEAAMAAEAKRYMEGALGASADSAMTRIMTDLGLPPLEMIDDTAPDFEAIRKRAKRKEAKPRKPKEKDEAAPKAETKTKAEKMLGTPDKPLTPAQIAAIERFINAPPSTWRTLWQTEMKNLRPLFGQMPFDNFNSEYLAPWKAVWQEELGLWGLTPTDGFAEWYDKSKAAQRMTSGDLFPQDINETTGIFDLNDPKAMMEVRNAFALARGTKMDAIMEFWRMSILTGPQTHIVNIGSNTMFAAYNLLPRRAAEASVNTVLSAIGMGSQEAATFGEFSVMAKNLRKAIQLGARQALTSWALESRTFDSYAEGGSLQLEFTGVGGETFTPKLGGKLGKVMRSLSFRAMTAADEFMKLTYGQLEAAANAHRIAKVEEKLTGAAYEARITELMQPGSVAWLRAMDGARRITFQDKIDGTNPKMIARIDQFAELAKKGRAMPWIGRPLTFFLPFIDTPTNIVKQAIEMSPLGGFIAVIDGTRALRRRYLRGKMSKAEAELAAGELYNRARFVQDVTNQTIAWTAYFALSGLVKPDDDDEDGRPFITGTQPYKTTSRGERDNAYAVMPPQSIRIGNTMFSYARMDPFASMMAGVVDLMQEIDRNNGTLNGAAASSYMMRLKDQLKDKTFLQGVSDLINAIEDPERFAENATANILTGFVPNIIRQPIRESDDVIRDMQPREEQGFLEAVARRIGYSVVPQMAPAKMDVWGNEIQSNRGKDFLSSSVADKLRRTLDPLNSSFGADADPIDAWIFQYNRLTADSNDRIGLSPIPAFITGTVDGRRTRIPLTAEEQAEANRNAGKAAREILGDDWDWKTAGTDTAMQRAEMIRETVRETQKFERARLRAQKLMEMEE